MPVELVSKFADHLGGHLVAAQRVGDDEPELKVQDRLEVLVGEHPAVPHEGHPAKIESLLEIPDHLRHRGLVQGVPGEDVVAQRDAVPRHHHADRDLPAVEPAVPAEAETPDVVLLDRFVPFEIGRGDVVEDQVHRRDTGRIQKAPGHGGLGLLLHGNQTVHRPQEVVVRRLLPQEPREVDILHPVQKRKLAAGVADPVDHHQPHQLGDRVFGVTGDPRFQQRLGEPDPLPGVVQRINVAEVVSVGEGDDRPVHGLVAGDLAETAGELADGVHAKLLQGAQVVDDTIAGHAPLFGVPVALAQVDGGVLPSLVPLAVQPDEHMLHIYGFIPVVSSYILCG